MWETVCFQLLLYATMQSKALFRSVSSAAHDLPWSIYVHFSIITNNEYCVLKPFRKPHSTSDNIINRFISLIIQAALNTNRSVISFVKRISNISDEIFFFMIEVIFFFIFFYDSDWDMTLLCSLSRVNILKNP